MKRSSLLRAGVGLSAAAAAAYFFEHRRSARYRLDDAGLERQGLTVPSDAKVHFLPTSDGGRLHVAQFGEGPPIVLIHGVMLALDVWAPVMRALGSSHQVVAISQRGHGHSLAGDEGYRFERLGLDVMEVLDALELRTATLVGHSMGGMVVQRLAARRPIELASHVARLVLIATSPGPVIPAPIPIAVVRIAEHLVSTAARRGRGIFSSDAGVWLTRIGFGESPSAGGVELTRQLIASMHPDALSALVHNLSEFSIAGRLGAISLPTDVVVGTKDRLTPVRTAKRIEVGIDGANLHVFAGCGHMVMLERVEKLCALLV